MTRVSWRFWPLADFERFGVLTPTAGKSRVARFLTPEEAKEEAERNRAA